MTSLVGSRGKGRLPWGAVLGITETDVDNLTCIEGLDDLHNGWVPTAGKCLADTAATAVIQRRIAAVVVYESTVFANTGYQ